MTALRQYLALSRRAILNTFRQPAAIVPALLFPLMFMALSSAAFDRTTSIPRFPPVDSFLQFLIAATILQGALFGATSAGADMAKDIEDGFFERLIASPVARTSILVGRVAGSALFSFIQAWVYFGVASLFGLEVEGGLLGMALVAVVVAVAGAGIGSLMMAFAVRSGSSEAVQGAFPLIFVLLFFSNAFFPLVLMSGWFEAVASANPLTTLIDGIRHQVIYGADVGRFLTALAVAGGILVLGVSLAGVALRARLARGS